VCDKRIGLGKTAVIEQLREPFPGGEFAALVLRFDPGFTTAEAGRGAPGLKGVQLRTGPGPGFLRAGGVGLGFGGYGVPRRLGLESGFGQAGATAVNRGAGQQYWPGSTGKSARKTGRNKYGSKRQ